MNKIKLIAFDMDGTLFSSEKIIAPAYQEAIAKFNIKFKKQIKPPTTEEIFQFVGLPIKTILQNLFPSFSEKEKDFIHYYMMKAVLRKINNKEGEIYDGITELILKLITENYKLAIVSNGRIEYIKAILKTYKWKKLFFPVIGIDYKKINCKKDILNRYILKYKLTPDEVIMIGDRLSDKEGAELARTLFIGISYGHSTEGELGENVSIAKDPYEVYKLIKQLDF